jgi:transposase-like protein
LFLDGKYVEFRDGDRLRAACIYVVVGLLERIYAVGYSNYGRL